MSRRTFLISAIASAAFGTSRVSAADGPFEITRTKAEWRTLLSVTQYNVMRDEGTERSGSSPLDKHYVAGIYHCRGCDQALYSSVHKFDSRTGWPSFFDVLPSAIQTKEDNSFFSSRTECHCDRCGSHLGHIFSDGPAPTGLRHCLNGVSLVFYAA